MSNIKRLLIVDDSEVDRRILRNILSRRFEIAEVENGYSALELLTRKSAKIDGVLLDLAMPVLDGFNVLNVMHENGIKIPVVLASDVVQRALENSDEYVCSYRIRHNGRTQYFQAAFFRIFSRRNSGSQIILGFRNIDAIVEEERKNIRIQEEQLRIIDALSHEYHSLFKIDANKRSFELYRTDGIGMEPEMLRKLIQSGEYDDVISHYINAFVVPEDRERILSATTLDVLGEKVPDVGLYKLGYRRNMNGVISYYEMNVAKTVDKSGAVTFIMGLRDVNDEMQRQLKQARAIEEQSEIIEGLGSEYYSVLLVNPENDTVTAYRAEGNDGRDIADYFSKCDSCWSRGVLGYSEELVSEKSRGELREKMSLDRLRKGGENYSLTYEKLTKDGVMYLQARVAFVREKDGALLLSWVQETLTTSSSASATRKPRFRRHMTLRKRQTRQRRIFCRICPTISVRR
ncbi:MAG: response regulator [Oscillospiraceae bacterium]